MRSLPFALPLLASALSLAVASCCCPCKDGCGCDPSACDNIDLDPAPSGPRIDLGVSSHPATHTAGNPTVHEWTAQRLNPSGYRIGYRLSPTEAADIRKALNDFARSVGYRPMNDDTFMWSPGPECQGDMRCVFENMAARGRPGVLPIAERFRQRATESGMTVLQATELIVAFVQDIRYEIPKAEPFGVLPPALVMSESRGDCDSKALLGLMLLRELNVSSILISSEAHHHTMLAVALPASGRSFTYAGQRYAFVECTAKGSPIGHINPELLSPNDWRAVPVRVMAAP